jgi:hypothetical protein
MLLGHYNGSNRIVTGRRAGYTLPYETTILKNARRETVNCFLCSKIFVLLHLLQWRAVAFIRCFPFVGVSNFIQTPSVDRRIFLMGPMLGGPPDVALHTDVAPFADNRFDCCDLLQRNVIYHGTGKASGIRLRYSCRTDRPQTISLKGRTIAFDALGPIRTCESNLKPWAMRSWSRQLNSI